MGGALVPLNLDEISEAVRSKDIDFTLTNPGNYVGLETRYGISRIATMQSIEKDLVRVRFGAVIVARADNDKIHRLVDLKGRSFMAVSPEAFGGFQMAWRDPETGLLSTTCGPRRAGQAGGL